MPELITRTSSERWQRTGNKIIHRVRGITLTIKADMGSVTANAVWLEAYLNSIDAEMDKSYNLNEELTETKTKLNLLSRTWITMYSGGKRTGRNATVTHQVADRLKRFHAAEDTDCAICEA